MQDNASLSDSAKRYLSNREQLLAKVASNPEFEATGLPMYPHDSISANLPLFLDLFNGVGDFLNVAQIDRVLDIGGANGDIAITFALAGCQTTMVDLTLPWSCGPLIASLLNKELNANLRVIDLNVDGYFSYQDIERHTVNIGQYFHESNRQDFDLVLCTGLLYHLKNPFAFLESVHRLTKYVVLQTWIMSYLPDNITKLDGASVAYLLDYAELNNDASNYWIFTHESLHRLVKRCGFDVVNSSRLFIREDKISNPIDPLYYGEQEYLLLKRVEAHVP